MSYVTMLWCGSDGFLLCECYYNVEPILRYSVDVNDLN